MSPGGLKNIALLVWNGGYGGSGPADFALNIMSIFISQEEAEKNGLYQDFKWEFVSQLPHEGGTIPRDVILNWLEKKGVKNNERL